MVRQGPRAGPSRRPRVLVALAIPLLAAALSACGAATASPSVSAEIKTWRDASGLLMMSDVPSQAAPEGLVDTHALAGRIAGENPKDFGSPRIEGDHVILPVTSARTKSLANKTGASLTDALTAYEQERKAAPDLPEVEYGKTKNLGSDDVAQALGSGKLRLVPGERSNQESVDTLNGAMKIAGKEFATARPWQALIDSHSGLILISMEKLTPSLAKDLAEHYGTETLAIIEAPALDGMPGSGET
jgi:hypothetical protein